MIPYKAWTFEPPLDSMMVLTVQVDMSKGDHSDTLLLLALVYQSTPSCLKVRGGKWECACGHVELSHVLDLAVHLVIEVD